MFRPTAWPGLVLRRQGAGPPHRTAITIPMRLAPRRATITTAFGRFYLRCQSTLERHLVLRAMRVLTFPPVWKLRLCTAVFAGLCLASPLSADGLSPLEKHGKQIYREATSPSAGEVTAIMGKDRIEVPAAIVPCVSCHGHDGLGRAEGGLVPSNITWEVLSKPYGVRRADGREHPPYDERLLKRSFTMGIDPGSNELDVAMPRYRMTNEAAEALVAYLKVLGSESDPGVDETRVRLGVILPPAGPLGVRVISSRKY